LKHQALAGVPEAQMEGTIEELILEELHELRNGHVPAHKGGKCPFHFLVDRLALPGPRDEFAVRFATLTAAVESLQEEGKITLSGSSLNPAISLK
jgi:hypothetical protein